MAGKTTVAGGIIAESQTQLWRLGDYPTGRFEVSSTVEHSTIAPRERLVQNYDGCPQKPPQRPPTPHDP